MYSKVKRLLDDSEFRTSISKNAYKTIADEWNAENAAKHLMALCEKLLAGEKSPDVFENGVCSKAEILKDDWYD